MHEKNEQLRAIGPWLSRYPLPSTMGVYVVTHDMAGDWLDYRSRPGTEHQRKLSATKVNQYTAVMNAGNWKLHPQGLIFDTEGWLFNGQHRLQALRNSDLAELEFYIFPDQASDLFSVIDTGAVRQARQLYNGKYASIITAAPRYLGAELGRYITTMTPQEQLLQVERWPELTTHANNAQAAQIKLRIPGAPHLAVMAQAERTEYRDKLPSWWDGILHGIGLTAGDPRLQLRERYIHQRGRKSPENVYNTIMKAWNLHARGERMQYLVWREVEGMIPIVGGGGKR